MVFAKNKMHEFLTYQANRRIGMKWKCSNKGNRKIFLLQFSLLFINLMLRFQLIPWEYKISSMDLGRELNNLIICVC